MLRPFVTGCLGFVEAVVSTDCVGSRHVAHGTRNITGADTNPSAQPFAGTAEYLCEGAVDYSCCFTKFPFGSTSNRDSLPFALRNTS